MRLQLEIGYTVIIQHSMDGEKKLGDTRERMDCEFSFFIFVENFFCCVSIHNDTNIENSRRLKLL